MRVVMYLLPLYSNTVSLSVVDITVRYRLELISPGSNGLEISCSVTVNIVVRAALSKENSYIPMWAIYIPEAFNSRKEVAPFAIIIVKAKTYFL